MVRQYTDQLDSLSDSLTGQILECIHQWALSTDVLYRFSNKWKPREYLKCLQYTDLLQLMMILYYCGIEAMRTR